MTRLAVRCSFTYPSGFHLRAAFEVGPGVTAVVGPSGGGKSTLVALIAGLLFPDEGSIRFGGKTFADTAAGTFASPHTRRVGVSFQDGRLFPHLSIRRNLLYGRRRFRTITPSVASVIEALELGDHLDRRPDALSGGQRQRVALGRALLAGTELLLLDEPVSALDISLRGRVLDFVRETVAADRRTCLIITHEPATAERLNPVGTIPVTAGRVGDLDDDPPADHTAFPLRQHSLPLEDDRR